MSDERCYHCHDPIPKNFKASVIINGEARPMCCYGCQTIAQMILDSGMSAFYRRRQGTNQKPVELVPEDLTLYDDQAIQQFAVTSTTVQSQIKHITLVIGGVHCAACSWLIEQSLQKQKGIQSASVNSVTQIAKIHWNESELKLSDILALLHRLGYQPSIYSPDRHSEQMETDYRHLLKRVGVAGLGMMQVMMFSVGLYVGAFDSIEQSHQSLLQGASFLITTIVLFYSAGFLLQGAAKGLLQGQIRLDVPIALALLLAYFGSVASMVFQGEHVFFDSVVMFAFFLLVGRFWELSIRHRSARALLRLNKRHDLFTQLLLPNGQCQRVPVSELKTGQVIRIEVGEVIPVDGTLLSEKAEVNLSVLTGEALPASLEQGTEVCAGGLNVSTPIRLKVNSSAQDSSYQHLLSASDSERESRAPYAELVDSIAPYFVFIILVIAAVSALFWLPFGIESALWIAVTVLAVSCPCALSLAAPVAFSFAQLALSKSGIVIRDRRFIELLPKITDVVFDKTGTITELVPGIEKIENYSKKTNEQLLAIAAALQDGRHPIAMALEPMRDHDLLVSERQASVGGVSGGIAGKLYHFGSAQYLQAQLGVSVQTGAGQSYLYEGKKRLAAVSFSERLRLGVTPLCSQLKNMGIRVHLLSGDSLARVKSIATKAGIESYRGECTAEGKLQTIKALQDAGGKVLMIGDGVNDLSGLACADLSLAMADGSAATINRCDAVIDGHSLEKVNHFLRFSHQVRYVIQQNALWAISYNIVAVSMAAFGLLTPYWAALGMSLSSIAVLVNASRLSKAGVFKRDASQIENGRRAVVKTLLQERAL